MIPLFARAMESSRCLRLKKNASQPEIGTRQRLLDVPSLCSSTVGSEMLLLQFGVRSKVI